MTLNFSGRTPMYLGMYEWELHRFFREVLPHSRLAFDVGGSLGYDALLFAINSPGRVVTFEPDPSESDALRANVDLNPDLRGRIVVDGRAVTRAGSDGSATLDSLASEFGPPDFIKIDIDGGELDALLGGESLLRSRRPDLVVETHSRELERDCGSFLLECGYRPIIKHNRRIWREQRGGAEHNRWLLAAGSSTT